MGPESSSRLVGSDVNAEPKSLNLGGGVVSPTPP